MAIVLFPSICCIVESILSSTNDVGEPIRRPTLPSVRFKIRSTYELLLIFQSKYSVIKKSSIYSFPNVATCCPGSQGLGSPWPASLFSLIFWAFAIFQQQTLSWSRLRTDGKCAKRMAPVEDPNSPSPKIRSVYQDDRTRRASRNPISASDSIIGKPDLRLSAAQHPLHRQVGFLRVAPRGIGLAKRSQHLTGSARGDSEHVGLGDVECVERRAQYPGPDAAPSPADGRWRRPGRRRRRSRSALHGLRRRGSVLGSAHLRRSRRPHSRCRSDRPRGMPAPTGRRGTLG